MESSVAQEAPLPASPGALQERVSELQVRGRVALPSICRRWGVGVVTHGATRVHGAMSPPPQSLRRELLEQQACVLGLHRELKATEHACSTLQNSFREFCQDLPHQQRQVRALTDRYHAVGDQLDLR